MVRTGLDVLLDRHVPELRGRRVGVLTNHTGVTRDLEHGVDALRAAGVRVTALFAPEHGVRGSTQAGEAVATSVDPVTGIPVYSLYGGTERPTAQMLAEVDVLLIDLQDIGARFYTYPWTAVHVMAAAAAAGIPVWVLDRPNPIGGLAQDVEGPLLDPRFASLVGLYPVPIRHGLTIGELARYVNGEFGLGCDLRVIPMIGWRREMWWEDTGLPFVPMSPNAPSADMAALYCGTCLIEGTNVSEGRGTTKPFEWIGAPWIDGPALARTLNALDLPGVRWRPVYFTPTFHKYAGQECQGVQPHVLDRRVLRPVALGVHLLAVLKRLYPERFAWRVDGQQGRPGLPIDRLAGTDALRLALDRGTPADAIVASWTSGEADFARRRVKYLLY